MKLRSQLPDPERAWDAFLEFSPGSRDVLAQNEILSAGSKSPKDLLIEKGSGKYKIEWKKLGSQAGSPSKKWEALRTWQRAELVRLGFVAFATPAVSASGVSAFSVLAEFTLGASLGLAREEAPETDQAHLGEFSVLALGKLGAGDLNFFSDLDLIFCGAGEEKGDAETRLARSLVGKIDERGGNSLYRVDLRLRPEGDQGTLVPTSTGLEDYYQAYGEVWERCAWIRARQVGGDAESAYHLFQTLQAFIYPRGLSPSALGELFQQKSRAEDELITPADRDREIKRGRGGLREVEFPVLGLQLLHGATQPTLQTHDLRRAIRNLETLGILRSEEAETLLGGYNFWRRLEDRLQMRHIRQTHLLPEEEEVREGLAKSMDLSSAGELGKAVDGWRDRVRAVYDSIFAEIRPTTVAFAGSTFPSSIDWQDKVVAEAAWSSLAPSGEVHATARTRENFQRMRPLLEKQLEGCARPDLALGEFANFTQGYGARSLLYESLCVSPQALELLIRFFESSRALGPRLVAHPELFEEVVQAGLDGARTLAWHRAAWKIAKEDGEEAMGKASLYTRGEELRIALRGLLGLAPIPILQAELTALAEASLGWAWEFAGKPKWAWVGLGKLGGGALSFGSDLDLLVVGEGEDSLQRAIHFLSAERATGPLFKTDFRLRPYAEGALVVPVKRYAEYYGKEAQSWEVQALCRARWVGGAKGVGQEFWPAVEKTWKKVGQSKTFFEEVKAMRERIATERVKVGEEAREYKTARGGLIDIEFAAQAWQMRQGLVETSTEKVLQAMRQEFPREAESLLQGLEFWSQAEWWVRLDEGRGGVPLPGVGVNLEWLAKRCGGRNGKEWMEKVAKVFCDVHRAYGKILK